VPETNEKPSWNGPSASVLFFFAESPVHAGAGGGEAALDLPVQRSVQTGWPILNDGTVRGGLRRLAGANQDEWFGTEMVDNPRAGKFSTPDAEMLLFPVPFTRYTPAAALASAKAADRIVMGDCRTPKAHVIDFRCGEKDAERKPPHDTAIGSAAMVQLVHEPCGTVRHGPGLHKIKEQS